MYQSINPVDNQLLVQRPSWGDLQLDVHLEEVRTYYHQTLKSTSLEGRITSVHRVAARLEKNREQFAQLITLEIGKPITQSRAEIDKCISLCNYYCDIAPQVLANREEHGAKIIYQPIGAVLGIMPWNYPIWQVFRYAIPAFLAGNVVLLKPASIVPQCSRAIELLFQDLSLKYCLSVLWIEESQVASAIKHPLVQGIALTGSDRAGAVVAAHAASSIKKCVLELGGNDALIVLRDADVEGAAQLAVQSRLKNGGQSCISAKRFIVEAPIVEAFTAAVIKAMKEVKMGNPIEEETELGVLACTEVVERLEAQVEDALSKGAEVLLEGGRSNTEGNYFSPMLLTNIHAQMRAYHEELFGPVALLFSVQDEAEAIKLANDSPYGLGAAVWSKDQKKAERVARALEVGAVAINKLLSSDPRLPFGGVKRSGYGKELGPEGLLEFVNQKTLTFGA